MKYILYFKSSQMIDVREILDEKGIQYIVTLV